MPSPRRERRSASPQKVQDKRLLDLVSTRRESIMYPPKPRTTVRRPFFSRRGRGWSSYRGLSSRGSSRSYGSHRGRSRSRSHSGSRRSHGKYSRERIKSRSPSQSDGRHHKKYSKSSSQHSYHHRSRSSSSSSSSYHGKQKESRQKRERSYSHSSEARVKKKNRSSASKSEESDMGGELSQEGHHRQDHQMKGSLKKLDEEASNSKGKPDPLIPGNKLHKLFTAFSHEKSFHLDEDISIAIQRNPYAEPSEESTVTKVFVAELFAMIRSPDEGQKPIFDREEIRMFGHDTNLADDPDFERRVVRIKPSKASHKDKNLSGMGNQRYASLEIVRMVRRDISQPSPSTAHLRSCSPSSLHKIQKTTRNASPSSQEQKRYRISRSNSPAARSRDRLKEQRDSNIHSRHSSLHRKEPHGPSERMPRGFRERENDKDLIRPSRDYRSSSSYDARQDRYNYPEWKDNPEMIPKDPRYFQHDDREDEEDYRNQGRSRGYRGRFISRGRRPFRPIRGYRGSRFLSSRGSGSYKGSTKDRYYQPYSYDARTSRKSTGEGEWKHDKFAELERGSSETAQKEDDQHPHSTSER